MRTIAIMALFQSVILCLNYLIHCAYAQTLNHPYDQIWFYSQWTEDLQQHFKIVQVFGSLGALFIGFILAMMLRKNDDGVSDHRLG